MGSLLKLEHVTICYNVEPVVHDVDLELNKGEILGVVGESGSGKSTIIKAIMGLLGNEGMVTEGDIWYKGKNVVDMLEKEEYGKYHATNEGGYISWCDFAKEIFRQAGMDVRVLPVSSAEYPAKAKRPSNSRMEKKKLEEHEFTRLPDWKDALKRYLKEIM